MNDLKKPASKEKRGPQLQAFVNHFKQLKKEERTNQFSCHVLAKMARENRLWVFDPEIKKWYTPEEFAAMYERYITGQEALVQRIQLRDPFEGIEAAYHQMESLQSRAKAFTLRVLEYFGTIK
jgi:hypothetical protein